MEWVKEQVRAEEEPASEVLRRDGSLAWEDPVGEEHCQAVTVQLVSEKWDEKNFFI